jgi:hypothetical protein
MHAARHSCCLLCAPALACSCRLEAVHACFQAGELSPDVLQ